MSAAADVAATSRPASPRLPTSHRLRALHPHARRRPRLFYAITALLGAGTIAAAQMLFSILATQTSYALSELRLEQRSLQWQTQILTDEISGLTSPQYLAANAAASGMVIASSPSFLRLSDSAVLGTQESSVGASAVNALERGAVPNALVATEPLVTDPNVTIMTNVQPESSAKIFDTPPPITEGLPTPRTH